LICNRKVRWEFLLHHALSFGADYLATGHYARVERREGKRTKLLRGSDGQKDQSYVLHVLNQDQLSRAIFPLGEFTKGEVRQLARDFGLPVAERPESQDLCFLGGKNYRNFLERHAPGTLRSGPILNQKNEILGTHLGLPFYTIGQRKGLGVASHVPLYVLEKDLERNAIIVGTQADLGQAELLVEQLNWVSIEPPARPVRAQVRIRYKAIENPAIIIPQNHGQARVIFDDPVRDITPGQAAVFYDQEICLGGGIIESSA
jgi:tRNA-specific 2-thiouridylase